MHDKELIRRALLGDQEAQKKCTEKGILIPCPWCKGEMQICHGDNYGYYKTKCICCGAESPEKPSEWEAISRNNTRPAPPIRKCGECALWKEEKECPGAFCCTITGMERESNDFCSEVEPKEK